MVFQLSDEQRMIKETAIKIAKQFGPEYWREREMTQEWPKDFFGELGKAGILGLGIPEKYGGTGMGLMEAVIAVETLCSEGGGLAPALMYLVGVIFGGMSIVKHGNEEQKKKYLPKIANGEMQAALGLTEPDAGTDTLNIRTFAQKEANDYVINGNKIFISGFENAGIIILVTRTKRPSDVQKKTAGLSLFLIEIPNPSIQYTSIPKMGINYAKTYELGIENLRVPQECLLGQENKGWNHILDTLNPERIIGAAGAVGCGRIAVRKAVEYSKERVVFSRPIGANQGLQFPLASSYAKLECAWLATLQSASLYDHDENSKRTGDIANIAKYVSVVAAFDAITAAMQTLGGYGYAKEYHIERWLREIFLAKVAPITQEMTLNYIGEHILGMPKSY
jgi:acyl-CoA dehydrogenase